jgi:SAM-dependent methyltransferase
MTKVASDNNYAEAVSRGDYDIYSGGLAGPHDNVRTYWEDQIRGIRLRPYLTRLVNRKKRAGERLCVADLGCGSGEGLRLLTSWIRAEEDLGLDQTRVLPMEAIESYVGCDLSPEMVEQGCANFADCAQVCFKQGDFSEGFALRDEAPFDLYFSTYGSFSHISTDQMERLLTEIVDHVGRRALVVGDWLGRHSIEWPCYWGENDGHMLDYTMNWMARNGSSDDAEHFPMRYWTGDEITSLAKRVAEKTRTRINVLDLYDCSVFVGRHVDTGEYNDWVSPVRAAVNRLHEPNMRTDFDELKCRIEPTSGHDDLNQYYDGLRYCWNNLITYCQRRLERKLHPIQVKEWRAFPPALQMAVMTLDRVIDTVSWMRMGDPRANIIEPQLGYALRNLEMELQRGLGRGHALVGILEVRKESRAASRVIDVEEAVRSLAESGNGAPKPDAPLSDTTSLDEPPPAATRR